MKHIHNFWLPDSESHLIRFLERGPYQAMTREIAVSFAERKRTCVDVGAHCGLWSKYLVDEFDTLVAFEPVAAHRECFRQNVAGSYVLEPVLLGEESKADVQIAWEADNTGHTHIGDGDLRADMKRLDDYRLTDVDFIKMDCEGYEYYVCLGAEETIKKYKPVICVEQKPHGFYGIEQLAAVKLLASWGARLYEKIRADYILGWN